MIHTHPQCNDRIVNVCVNVAYCILYDNTKIAFRKTTTASARVCVRKFRFVFGDFRRPNTPQEGVRLSGPGKSCPLTGRTPRFFFGRLVFRISRDDPPRRLRRAKSAPTQRGGTRTSARDVTPDTDFRVKGSVTDRAHNLSNLIGYISRTSVLRKSVHFFVLFFCKCTHILTAYRLPTAVEKKKKLKIGVDNNE